MTSPILNVVHHDYVWSASTSRSYRHWVSGRISAHSDRSPTDHHQELGHQAPTATELSKAPMETLRINNAILRVLSVDNSGPRGTQNAKPEVEVSSEQSLRMMASASLSDHAVYSLARRTVGQLSLAFGRAVNHRYQRDAGEDEQLDSPFRPLECYLLAITITGSKGVLVESPPDLLARWEEMWGLIGGGLDKHSNLEASIAFSISIPLMQDNFVAPQVLN